MKSKQDYLSQLEKADGYYLFSADAENYLVIKDPENGNVYELADMYDVRIELILETLLETTDTGIVYLVCYDTDTARIARKDKPNIQAKVDLNWTLDRLIQWTKEVLEAYQ